jgi:excisionase family DNA binding protein
MQEFLTTQQAAEKLGVSASRVRQFIIDGRLPAIKLGRDNLIRETDLKLVEDRKAGRPPNPNKIATKNNTGSRNSKKKRTT